MSRAWRKVLYEDFNVPDNYVDSSFLKNMRKNLYTKEYNFYETVIEAGSVHHQFCWILIFVLIYIFMSVDIISLANLSIILFAFIVAACSTILIIDQNLDNFWMQVRIGIATLVFNVILCPVLFSLTTSISTDTIYALTLFLLLGSWACHSYSPVDSCPAIGNIELSPLSVNAGLMASLCLASRLPSLWHTFMMVNSAMAIFGLQPNFTCKVKRILYPYLQVSMTAILSLICFIGLWFSVSVFVTVCFVLLTFGINIICPLIFLRMQRLKNNIHGPWDEAVPR